MPLDALFLPLSHTFAAHAEHSQLQLIVRASGLWVRSDAALLHRIVATWWATRSGTPPEAA